MAWNDGVDVTTGDLITAAQWNSYLGITGSLMYLKTREIWTPCTGWFDDSLASYNPPWDWGGKCTDVDDYAYVDFKAPFDFASIDTAFLRCHAAVTQANANIDIRARYSAAGEAFDTHDESDNATTYAITNTQQFDIDVSGILTALAAGDSGILSAQTKDGENFYVRGFYLKYVGGT